MNNIKKIKLLALITLLGLLVYFFIPGINEFLDFRRAAEAAGGCPIQDGGKISMVREPCILDTPVSSPVTCAISCPLVTSAVGTLCTGYIEIDTISQLGTPFIAAPISFVYRGGGVHPKPNDDFLLCAASPAVPYVIGIPGTVSGKTVFKLANYFNRLLKLL